MIPSQVFFTKGVGVHKDRLSSFEDALRMAGIQACNLVTVSSILPPRCKIIPRRKGIAITRGTTISGISRAKTNLSPP